MQAAGRVVGAGLRKVSPSVHHSSTVVDKMVHAAGVVVVLCRSAEIAVLVRNGFEAESSAPSAVVAELDNSAA